MHFRQFYSHQCVAEGRRSAGVTPTRADLLLECISRINLHRWQAPMNKPFILITALIALVLIAGGAIWFFKTVTKLEDYQKTEGEIVELVPKLPEKDDVDRDVLYYPKIQYFDQHGQEHVFQSKIGSESPRGKLGEKVSIRFNRDYPSQHVIDSFARLWLGPTLLVVVGCFLLTCLLAAVRKNRI